MHQSVDWSLRASGVRDWLREVDLELPCGKLTAFETAPIPALVTVTTAADGPRQQQQQQLRSDVVPLSDSPKRLLAMSVWQLDQSVTAQFALACAAVK